MSRKKTPELVDLPEEKLEEIKTRLSSNCLEEEDRAYLMGIVLSYSWLFRQIQHTKITINRLKSLFGFSTEKKKKKKKLSDVEDELPAVEGPESVVPQVGSLDELQGVNALASSVKKLPNLLYGTRK